MRGCWNANTHYHSCILGSLPPGASRILDVGCKGVDHFVGATCDSTFEAAQSTVGREGEEPPVSPRFVKRVENEFEKRQRSRVG